MQYNKTKCRDTEINIKNRSEINLSDKEIHDRSWIIQGWSRNFPLHMGYFNSIMNSIRYVVINYEDLIVWIPLNQLNNYQIRETDVLRSG